jgi:hypothetical protein
MARQDRRRRARCRRGPSGAQRDGTRRPGHPRSWHQPAGQRDLRQARARQARGRHADRLEAGGPGRETKPFNASIGAYNAKGMLPPPTGNPNKQDIAVEVFYEAGTATGVEGIDGEQTSATFGSVAQVNNPQVSFSDIENKAPETMLAN